MAGRHLALRVVDVFTRSPFQGNPAGVVLDASGLSDEQMQGIAAEVNLSETAFVLPADSHHEGDLRLRWFTPSREVDMCGHATIAAVHALYEADLLPPIGWANALRIQTRGGLLQARIEPSVSSDEHSEERIVWLDLVPPSLETAPFTPQAWAGLFGEAPEVFVDQPAPVRTQDGDLILFVRDAVALNGLQPVHSDIISYTREKRIRGICVATTSTLTPSLTVQSRFFAPAVGIPEDPVTGSVHGPLAAHLVASEVVRTFEDLAALTCSQASSSGRAGLVRVLVQRQEDGRFEVRIGGECVTVTKGTLYPEGFRQIGPAFQDWLDPNSP